MEITKDLSDMSELNHDNGTQIPIASEELEVFFTNAVESTGQKHTPVVQRDEFSTTDSSPTNESTTEESSPMGSMPNSPWQILLIWAITRLTFFLTVIEGLIESVRVIFGSWLVWFRTEGVWIFSFITNLLQAILSATSCSTAQYKPHLRFFCGSYLQYGVWTAIGVLMVAVLLQCTTLAANVGPRVHINASKSLLTKHSISRIMSEGAAESILAESLLKYMHGNWLFSYERHELEVHVATLSKADCDFCLDWYLDSDRRRRVHTLLQ
jgi:hypothetical protein